MIVEPCVLTARVAAVAGRELQKSKVLCEVTISRRAGDASRDSAFALGHKFLSL